MIFFSGLVLIFLLFFIPLTWYFLGQQIALKFLPKINSVFYFLIGFVSFFIIIFGFCLFFKDINALIIFPYVVIIFIFIFTIIFGIRRIYSHWSFINWTKTGKFFLIACCVFLVLWFLNKGITNEGDESFYLQWSSYASYLNHKILGFSSYFQGTSVFPPTLPYNTDNFFSSVYNFIYADCMWYLFIGILWNFLTLNHVLSSGVCLPFLYVFLCWFLALIVTSLFCVLNRIFISIFPNVHPFKRFIGIIAPAIALLIFLIIGMKMSFLTGMPFRMCLYVFIILLLINFWKILLRPNIFYFIGICGLVSYFFQASAMFTLVVLFMCLAVSFLIICKKNFLFPIICGFLPIIFCIGQIAIVGIYLSISLIVIIYFQIIWLFLFLCGSVLLFKFKFVLGTFCNKLENHFFKYRWIYITFIILFFTGLSIGYIIFGNMWGTFLSYWSIESISLLRIQDISVLWEKIFVIIGFYIMFLFFVTFPFFYLWFKRKKDKLKEWSVDQFFCLVAIVMIILIYNPINAVWGWTFLTSNVFHRLFIYFFVIDVILMGYFLLTKNVQRKRITVTKYTLNSTIIVTNIVVLVIGIVISSVAFFWSSNPYGQGFNLWWRTPFGENAVVNNILKTNSSTSIFVDGDVQGVYAYSYRLSAVYRRWDGRNFKNKPYDNPLYGLYFYFENTNFHFENNSISGGYDPDNISDVSLVVTFSLASENHVKYIIKLRNHVTGNIPQKYWNYCYDKNLSTQDYIVWTNTTF